MRWRMDALRCKLKEKDQNILLFAILHKTEGPQRFIVVNFIQGMKNRGDLLFAILIMMQTRVRRLLVPQRTKEARAWLELQCHAP